MQAIAFHEYGTPEVLQRVELPLPALTPDSVRVRVMAAGVNPADTAIRSGMFRLFLRLSFPHVPGSDVAGIVDAVGENVTRFKSGDAVYAMLPTGHGGAYAESISVNQDLLAPMPTGITFVQAAGVPLAALTALQALRDKADIQPHQRVLIYGASGGVGTFAVQIARVMGAEVTGVCSTRNVEMVKSLGAHHVIDYTQQPIDNGQYDIVLDAAAKLPFSDGLKALRRGGVLVSLNPGMNNPFSKLVARLRGRRLTALLVQPNTDDLAHLSRWIAEGDVCPVIDKVYPLGEAAEAHRYSETRRARGKLVLAVGDA